MRGKQITLAVALLALLAGCSDNPSGPQVLDPATAPRASIDRFSEMAGTLFVRDGSNGLPEANAPIDMDSGPFITQGLGPNGEVVKYYNFDVMPTTTAPIFALFREGEDMPVAGQLNIVDDIPGDADYSDFWHVHKVTVPADYVANSAHSLQDIMDAGYTIESTNMIVNCPIVPFGSTATLRYQDNPDKGLTMGWFRDQVVFYFNFVEKAITVTPPAMGHPTMPTSPIWVTFNINPDPMDAMSGPPSGFVTEMDGVQTHNVPSTLPDDSTYSPFWLVNVYDNADFATVSDLSTAMAATQLASGVALVNCPIVSVTP